jgi:hypothetical protein
MAGTLTIAWGAQSTACTFTTSGGGFSNQGSPLQGTLGIMSGTLSNGTCANGQAIGFAFAAKAWKDGGAFSLNQTSGNALSGFLPFAGSPYWYTAAWSAPAAWVNGNATTTSKLTFNNTTVGTSSGVPVRATGTVNVTRSAGALLTLQ